MDKKKHVFHQLQAAGPTNLSTILEPHIPSIDISEFPFV